MLEIQTKEILKTKKNLKKIVHDTSKFFSQDLKNIN